MSRLNDMEFASAFAKSAQTNGNEFAARVAAKARALRRLLGVLYSEVGTVTVEFMLWMPLVFLVILFAIDVSLIYLKQADMWNVARDQARRMSVSPTYNPTAAQIKQDLFSSLQVATATSAGATTPATNKVVTITIPLCQASLFGVVGCYDNSLTLTARVTMASEY